MVSSAVAWLIIANILFVANVTEDADIGGPLYRSMCAACHGFTGSAFSMLSKTALIDRFGGVPSRAVILLVRTR
jgi:mono/diheme cytochrome c family protein